MNYSNSPIIIGGVGGSGTRLAAQAIKLAGYHLGNDLTSALDNNTFTYLFRRSNFILKGNDDKKQEFIERLKLFEAFSTGANTSTWNNLQNILKITSSSPLFGTDPTIAWKIKRLALLLHPPNKSNLWGWKNTINYIFIDGLAHAFPSAKYIHVIRNGIDIALSNNQNHYIYFRDLFLTKNTNPNTFNTISDRIDFWLEANLQTIEKSKSLFGKNFITVHYDNLCLNPKNELKNIYDFVCKQPDANLIKKFCSEITNKGKKYDDKLASSLSIKQKSGFKFLGITI